VLAAVILTVEMTYKVSVDSSNGTLMKLFGAEFDAAAAGPWAVAIGLWIVGGWLFNAARKRVAHTYGEIQAEFLQGRP
jgi:branched-chain amino acid transport system permease protein